VRFKKLGLVFCPDGSHPLMRAHAMTPTPILMNDVLRVYFGATDDDTRGRIFYLELDPADPRKIVSDVSPPVLGLGSEGAFDMHGVIPTSLVENGDELWLYYVGFQRLSVVPYTLLAGLAVSTNGGESFARVQEEAVLPPIPTERFVRSAPSVLRGEQGWSMWYIGGNDWIEHEGKQLPVYGLRFTTSRDGRRWSEPIIVFDPDPESRQIGFGRPFVSPTEGGFEMFLSVRTVEGYTLSHATSSDGLRWGDWEHDVMPAAAEWESQMRCFAAPIAIDGTEYVFYNGNGYGRTGFGLAILDR
jgi:hypothetical protein